MEHLGRILFFLKVASCLWGLEVLLKSNQKLVSVASVRPGGAYNFFLDPFGYYMSYTVVTNVPDLRQPLTKVKAPGVSFWINSIGTLVTNSTEINFKSMLWYTYIGIYLWNYRFVWKNEYPYLFNNVLELLPQLFCHLPLVILWAVR